MIIRSLLEKCSFSHHFQPIYHLASWYPIGYEALFRSELTANPAETFQMAREDDQLYELDTLSIKQAIACFYQENSRHNHDLLFVNVYPSTIVHSGFINFMQRYVKQTHSIVLELNEAEPILDLEELSARIEELKLLGIKVAIDDVGKGASQLQSILNLKPNFIKLDRSLTQDLHLSRQKQTFIELAAMFCQQFNMTMILEGVETAEELDMAKSLRVPFAQGFAIGSPKPLLSTAR
ncbi:EAL domain-containing protein [Halobacillus litoralis]|uniref:EAL domain-containing protein n=1 Tax=Halobacillus litoralis TaxID=45668 RepID=UPI001CD67F4F|nr:EAL domain-containing protein [Halobacillus litoralis]MCA0972282.1 EAL domain-containing protein [Halobacillus litoralis]